MFFPRSNRQTVRLLATPPRYANTQFNKYFQSFWWINWYQRRWIKCDLWSEFALKSTRTLLLPYIFPENAIWSDDAKTWWILFSSKIQFDHFSYPHADQWETLWRKCRRTETVYKGFDYFDVVSQTTKKVHGIGARV